MYVWNVLLNSTYLLTKVVKYTDIAVRRLICHTATGTHVPHRITECYLPPDRGDIPAFTAAETGTRLSDPRGTQGWVDLYYTQNVVESVDLNEQTEDSLLTGEESNRVICVSAWRAKNIKYTARYKIVREHRVKSRRFPRAISKSWSCRHDEKWIRGFGVPGGMVTHGMHAWIRPCELNRVRFHVPLDIK